MARGWSTKMAGLQVLSHNPLLGVQTTAAGSAGWRALTENVGYASACDPKQLFDAYWASTAHRTHMLNRVYR